MFAKLTRRTALAITLAVAAAPAMATETIKAVVIDGYPARALWVKEFTEFFIPEVDKRLAETGNYKMEWQESYGGSIVKPKGVLEGVSLGLGDIGIVTAEIAWLGSLELWKMVVTMPMSPRPSDTPSSTPFGLTIEPP